MRPTFTLIYRNVRWLFLAYCSSLIYVVFFTPNRYRDRERSINVVPILHTYEGFFKRDHQHFWLYYINYWGNIVGNIILFLPFGFLLSCLFPETKSRYIVLAGFVTSFSIELTQYLLYIGVSDIDDVILNVCGTALGIFVFKKWEDRGCLNRPVS